MEARSTNTKGYVHYGHDVVAGVEEGIGIRLGAASTGGVAIIEPISDSDTAALTVKAKGAAALALGDSSNVVSIGGVPYAAKSTTFAYAYAALSSGQTAVITLASTTADINPGDLVSISLGAPTVEPLALLNVRYSTAAASRVTLVVGNITSTAFASTGSGTGRITWLDLTA